MAARPSVADWDPDRDGPNPSTEDAPNLEYAVKFLLLHLRLSARIGVNLRNFATVEYVARQALGHTDACPRYCR